MCPDRDQDRTLQLSRGLFGAPSDRQKGDNPDRGPADKRDGAGERPS